MPGIGELSVSVTARTAKAVKNIGKFRKSINTLPKTIKKVTTSIGGLTAGFAGLVSVGAATAALKKSFDSIDDLAKSADKLGLATEKLAGLQLAARETGVSASQLDSALQRMVRRVAEASVGAGEARGALQELGLSASRLASMTADQQFAAIARAMENVTSQSDKVRLAFKLFDSEGVALVNTLNLGEAGLNEAADAAEGLGLAINRVDAASIERANDALARMNSTLQGISNTTAVGLAPAIEGLAKTMEEFGRAGQFNGDIVLNAVEKIANGFGVVLDVVHTLELGWLKLKAVFIKSIEVMFQGLRKLDRGLVSLINTIPGVEIEFSQLLQVLEEDFARTARAMDAEFQKAFLADPPSAGIKSFFEDVRSNAALAADEIERAAAMAQALEKVNKFAKPGINKAASFLGGIFAQASNLKQRVIGQLADAGVGALAGTKQIKSPAREPLRALDARTTEGLAALRSSLHKSPEKKKEVKIQEKQRDLLGEIKVLLAGAVNKPGPEVFRIP